VYIVYTNNRTIDLIVHCSLYIDGLVSYDMRQGDRRGTDMEFFDFTYDGSVTNDQLTGGLGQLADYEIGDANFRLDNQNLGRKGYEWVGWRNDSGSTSSVTTASRPIEIIFRFDQVIIDSGALLVVVTGVLLHQVLH